MYFNAKFFCILIIYQQHSIDTFVYIYTLPHEHQQSSVYAPQKKINLNKKLLQNIILDIREPSASSSMMQNFFIVAYIWLILITIYCIKYYIQYKYFKIFGAKKKKSQCSQKHSKSFDSQALLCAVTVVNPLPFQPSGPAAPRDGAVGWDTCIHSTVYWHRTLLSMCDLTEGVVETCHQPPSSAALVRKVAITVKQRNKQLGEVKY